MLRSTLLPQSSHMPRSMHSLGPHSPSNFLFLPTEIHLQCFELACNSDLLEQPHSYRTALSMCLVSKYFNSLATPTLYNKLFLPGRSKIMQLSRVLGTRPRLAACVTHILLSDRRPRNFNPQSVHVNALRYPTDQIDDDAELEVPPTLAFEMPRTREGRVDRLQRLQSWLTQRSRALSAFRSAMLHILALTSPYLRTLAILLYGHYDRNADSGLSDALAIPYPALAELTVCEATLAVSWPRIVLPSLRRLHLACGTAPGLSAALDAVGTSCPRLERLRFTEPLLDGAFTATLFRVLGLGFEITSQPTPTAYRWAAGRSTRPHVSRLPYGLVRLTLQPTPFHLRATQDAQDSPNLFQQLTAMAEESDILELIPPAPTSFQSERYPLDIALYYWFDTLRGGQGCWY